MNIIDLTHTIEEGMPAYPGTEPPEIVIATSISTHGFEERLITMFSHTGTHIDAPSHVLQGAKTLSDYKVSDFIGEGVLIDVRGMKHITAEYLVKYTDGLKAADFAVFYSGWEEKWGREEYFDDFPLLDIEASHFLVNFNLKGVALDMISIDDCDTETFDNHKVFFERGVLIVENLKNLGALFGKKFRLNCIPLNIEYGDGSPIRAFAEIY